MSYLPLSSVEKQESTKPETRKHRNLVYPILKYPQPKPSHTLQSEITSSLGLQQLLYYNWFYSIFQCYLYAASQIYRFLYFQMEFGVPVRTIVGVISLVFEIFRLQNGFYGNIKESFPEIFAFLMLTMLTIAGQCIMISQMVPPSPLEWSILFFGIIMHGLQLLVCVVTMRKLTQSQKALFLWRVPGSKKK